VGPRRSDFPRLFWARKRKNTTTHITPGAGSLGPYLTPTITTADAKKPTKTTSDDEERRFHHQPGAGGKGSFWALGPSGPLEGSFFPRPARPCLKRGTLGTRFRGARFGDRVGRAGRNCVTPLEGDRSSALGLGKGRSGREVRRGGTSPFPMAASTTWTKGDERWTVTTTGPPTEPSEPGAPGGSGWSTGRPLGKCQEEQIFLGIPGAFGVGSNEEKKA